MGEQEVMWASQSTLVTPGVSFIGSRLVNSLLEKGATVRVADDFSSGKISNLEYPLKHRELLVFEKANDLQRGSEGKEVYRIDGQGRQCDFPPRRRGSWAKMCFFILRCRATPKHFAARCLIKPDISFAPAHHL